MAYIRKLAHEFTVEELDRELIIRGAQSPGGDPFQFREPDGISRRGVIMSKVKQMYEAAKSLTPNEELRHLDTMELAKMVIFKTRGKAPDEVRGRWDEDNRMDIYTIKDQRILKNAECVAVICNASSLTDVGDGTSILETRHYGRHFNLNANEPFREQPILAGSVSTGFLVKEDIIATTGHSIRANNLADPRFVFGFKMLDSQFAATRVPNTNIYKGIKILNTVRFPRKQNWELVKLDRKVIDHPVVRFSKKEISRDEPLYVIGHPVGLPLKYAPGLVVRTTGEVYFSVNLDVYSGNHGSPVFNSYTHEVIGMVLRGNSVDFRWTGEDWISITYPNPQFRSQGPECTRISEFS